MNEPTAITMSVSYSSDIQYTDIKRTGCDRDYPRHRAATLLAQAISALAATVNDPDLGRISDVVSIEVRKIFAEDTRGAR